MVLEDFAQTRCALFPTGTTFENIVGKGENAGKQHFLLPHYVFYATKDNCTI